MTHIRTYRPRYGNICRTWRNRFQRRCPKSNETKTEFDVAHRCSTNLATLQDVIGNIRGGSTLGRGHVLPRQIQKLADRSDVISKVPKCFKMQIFRGSAPDPAGGAYSAPPDHLADGEEARCSPSKNPTPLEASFLQVSGSNPLQSWQPY